MAFTLAQTGCWTPIQKGELSRLKTGQTNVLGSSTSGNTTTTVYALSSQTVTKEDGTLYQINGTYNLRLTFTNGAMTTFDHPIGIEETEAGKYTIKSGALPPTAVRLQEIQRVEVPDPKATGWAVAGAGGVAVLGILIYAFVLAKPDSSLH